MAGAWCDCGGGGAPDTDAAHDFVRVAGPLCRVCGLAELGATYERRGRMDAARESYARYFSTPSIRRADATDAFHREWLSKRVAMVRP